MPLQHGLLEKLTAIPTKALGALFGDSFWPNYEREVLPAWLQTSWYDEKNRLFGMDAGGLGFAFIGPPLSGVSPAMQDKIAGMMQQACPANTVMQFILWTSPDMERALTSYKSVRRNAEGEFLGALRDEMADFYRESAYRSIVSGGDIRLRDTKLLVTMKIPASLDPSEREIMDACELRDLCAANLKACGFHLVELTPPGYLRFMQTIFNWGPSASWRTSIGAEWDKHVPLSEQILDPDNDVRIDEKGIWLGDERVRILFPKHYPDYATFGQAYTYLGEAMSGSRGLRDPTLLCATILFGDREKDLNKLARESLWLTHQAGQSLTRFRPEIGTQKRDFDLATQQVGEGDRIVKFSFGMATFSHSEQASVAAAANVRAYMREFQIQMQDYRYICAPLFGNLMPFGSDVTAQPALKTLRRITTRGVAPLLPVMSEWRGTGTPTLLMASRNGQLMTLSNWDSDTNYNVCIAAESGSGKSFLAQTMFVGARQMGERFWIIDKGRSYRNIVEMLGGVRMEFGPNANICLNPFSIVEDYDDDADLLYGLISTMAAMAEPLTDLQASQVRRVMRQVYLDVGSARMTVDHVAEALLASQDQRIRDVGSQLYPFTSAGEYGRLFNGRNNYQADNPVVLLELDELDGRAHLQRVVLLQLMFQIRREMQRGSRGQRKHLLIDEAWELLSNGSTGGTADPIAAFIATSYRQFRKHNGAAWTITQSINDFFVNEVTRAIYENSAHKWLLGQRGEAVENARSTKRLDLGEHGFQLLRSVHTVRGEYSEVFCHTPYGYGVGRLIVPPLSRKLFSTTPSDVDRITRYRDSGMSLMAAVARVAREDGAEIEELPAERRQPSQPVTTRSRAA